MFRIFFLIYVFLQSQRVTSLIHFSTITLSDLDTNICLADVENVNLYTRNSMTGYSPENHNLLQRELRNYSDNEDESSPSFDTGFYGSSALLREGDGEGMERDSSAAIRQAESMHLACKALLLLVRHRGAHLKVRTG